MSRWTIWLYVVRWRGEDNCTTSYGSLLGLLSGYECLSEQIRAEAFSRCMKSALIQPISCTTHKTYLSLCDAIRNCFFKDGRFAFALWPLQEGQNELIISCTPNAKTSQVCSVQTSEITC